MCPRPCSKRSGQERARSSKCRRQQPVGVVRDAVLFQNASMSLAGGSSLSLSTDSRNRTGTCTIARPPQPAPQSADFTLFDELGKRWHAALDSRHQEDGAAKRCRSSSAAEKSSTRPRVTVVRPWNVRGQRRAELRHRSAICRALGRPCPRRACGHKWQARLVIGSRRCRSEHQIARHGMPRRSLRSSSGRRTVRKRRGGVPQASRHRLGTSFIQGSRR